MLLAPLVQGRKGEYKNIFDDMRRSGYVRVRVDGKILDLSDEIELDKQKKHTIEVVVDRLVIRKQKKQAEQDGASWTTRPQLKRVAEPTTLYEVEAAKESHRDEDGIAEPAISVILHEEVDPAFRQRLSDSLETTLKLGNGVVLVSVVDGEEILFSEKAACVYCGISLPEIAPRTFSFNSPHGACPTCTGLGVLQVLDPELIITNPELSVVQGAIAPWSKMINGSQWHAATMEALATKYHFSLDTPWKELSQETQQIILYGVKEPLIIRYTPQHGNTRNYNTHFEGVVNQLDRRYKQTESEGIREEIEGYMSARVCPDCRGARLKPEALAVTVGGRNIVQVTRLSISRAQQYFNDLEDDGIGQGRRVSQEGEASSPLRQGVVPVRAGETGEKNEMGNVLGDPLAKIGADDPLVLGVLSQRERFIARQILKEIRARLQFLIDVGLNYLTLDRRAASLSGGEAQRIRLATQIGSGLMGVLYILDEPSIGLHQRDNERLIHTLVRLRDLGNTLLVVEHDEDTMRAADHIIDIGPGAGEHGGYVIATGTFDEIVANEKSLTGDYLSRRKRIEIPQERRPGNGNTLTIRGARENNLKNIDVEIPLGKFVAITGVSGSGKSTLIRDILYHKLSQTFFRSHERPGEHDAIEGLENLDKVINIDQSPIGRTPRSNPATYTNAFTGIRDLFAQVPESRIRGYAAGRFSFNVKGGRCEACKGEGIVKIEMNFLPDVYVPCEICEGKRYNREALEIHYKGKSIADVLDMTVEEACDFFANVPSIHSKMKTLNDVGLGYMRLGQPATTLSGGEAQRVKLATELSRRATGRTMYILDEPTTGLHFADVDRLLAVLQRLVDTGNTIVVIEHNLDVIKSADWLIDLGPEGGDAGGRVIALGTPEEVAEAFQSYTGHFLKRMFIEEATHAVVHQPDRVKAR